jgi:hypothetical protein
MRPSVETMNGVKWRRCCSRQGSRYYFRFFLTLVRLQNLVRVFRTIGFGISISDTYVNDTISSLGPKAMDQRISSFFAFVLVKVARVT